MTSESFIDGDDLCDRCGRERAVYAPRYGWRRCERCEHAAWEANAAWSDLGQSVNALALPRVSIAALRRDRESEIRRNGPSVLCGRMFPDTIQRNVCRKDR